jgi:hypothetical protein
MHFLDLRFSRGAYVDTDLLRCAFCAENESYKYLFQNFVNHKVTAFWKKSPCAP